MGCYIHLQSEYCAQGFGYCVEVRIIQMAQNFDDSLVVNYANLFA